MARAVQKCPELMQPMVRIDTVTVLVPGASDTGSTGYTQADLDSVAALCLDLLEQQRPVVDSTPRTPTQVLVDRMRVQLCDLEPVELQDSLLNLKIWTQGGELRYWYEVEPRLVKAPVTTVVPQVVANPCPPAGVASWYRTAFWILATLILLGVAFVVLLVLKSLQHADPQG